MSYLEIEPPDDLIEITSFGSDIDLVNHPSRAHATPRHARYIYVVGAGSGNLGVKMTGSGGSTRPFTGVAAGRELIGKFTDIIAASTDVTQLLVGW